MCSRWLFVIEAFNRLAPSRLRCFCNSRRELCMVHAQSEIWAQHFHWLCLIRVGILSGKRAAMQCVRKQPKRSKSQELLHQEQSERATSVNLNLLGRTCVPSFLFRPGMLGLLRSGGFFYLVSAAPCCLGLSCCYFVSCLVYSCIVPESCWGMWNVARKCIHFSRSRTLWKPFSSLSVEQNIKDGIKSRTNTASVRERAFGTSHCMYTLCSCLFVFSWMNSSRLEEWKHIFVVVIS